MAALVGDARGVLVSCRSCGQMNRLRYDAIGRGTQCGKCRQALPLADAPVAVPDEAAFDGMLAASSVPIVVDFWAPWCGPCRAMAPEFDTLARRSAGRWLLAKVDTEQVPGLGARYRVMSIPTLAVFSNGREVARRSGAMAADALESFVRSVTG